MEKKVDMTYSFLWDTEPTDEQLETLMQEVAEEVRLYFEGVWTNVLFLLDRKLFLLDGKIFSP
jgi:hypothetical protein